MHTVVMGKHVVHKYSVRSGIEYSRNEKGIEEGVFTAKPRLVVDDEIDYWEEICRYEGTPQLDESAFRWTRSLYLSEDKCVNVENSIFRADLGEHRQFVDEIISERCENKEDAEEAFEYYTKRFNAKMIESNPKLKSYCDVHKLNPEDTDVISLFDVVYGHNVYRIEDGAIKEDLLTVHATANHQFYHVDTYAEITAYVDGYQGKIDAIL